MSKFYAKPLDMSAVSVDTRQRGARLHGLLASLCRNRSLDVVRSVKQADGFEAFRQLTLTLRPSSNNRGLALMGALTNWPAFNMGQLLQSQVLKLRRHWKRPERPLLRFQVSFQQAILLKCVSEPGTGNPGDNYVQGAQRAGLEVGPQPTEMEQFDFLR